MSTSKQSKTIVITGASSGIGKATAEKAVEAGFNVVICARSVDKLDDISEKLNAKRKGSVLAVQADVTEIKEISNVLQKAKDKFGAVDVVFANAGKGLSKAGVENGEPDEWASMLDVNVNGLIYTAKASIPFLKENKGHFIITSSIAGKISLKGSIYGASKWFAYGFGQNLASEMAEWDGRCTTICPGMVNTPFFDEAKPDKLEPDDIADAVIYAISAPERCSVREICLMPTH